MSYNPLSANPAKWSNTLKQFVARLPTNCLRVFDHFVGLTLKGLILMLQNKPKRLFFFSRKKYPSNCSDFDNMPSNGKNT